MAASERGGTDRLDLAEPVLDVLSGLLPIVAEHTVAGIVAEVPSYAGGFTGEMAANIEGAVQLALAGFLRLASATSAGDPSTPMRPVLDGAYALGKGEARAGRSMDALLAAYRVGARIAWRELSAATVDAGVDAGTMARFAELVFAYIDGLSASSVAGHAEELATAGRVRERRRERLAGALIAGRDEDALTVLAERAEWPIPQTLTAVVLPADRLTGVLTQLGGTCLRAAEDLPELDLSEMAVLLVCDAHGPGRRHLMRTLQGRAAYVGPARSWATVASSYARSLSAHRLNLQEAQANSQVEPLDTDEHLAALVLNADAEALADLRTRALAPLADQTPATAERLAETLRSWLLHQGRRDDVAAELHVHAQTVRYRMGQIRELFGDRLNDPATVRDLVLALAHVDRVGRSK